MLEKNKLKEMLDEGKIAVGSCVYSSSSALVELAGNCGLDFIRIDNEHSWRRDESVENMIRAAWFSGVVPLLRIDKDDPPLVRKALEIGAGGILIPHIKTAEDVNQVVEAAMFPPLGKRGISTLCFSAKWGTESVLDWIKWSHDQQLIGIMIENFNAIDQINEIMSIQELDYVLFGASDYSASIGKHGEINHPKVIGALKKTIKAAKKHGKYVCKGVGYPWTQNAKKFVNMGCHMIEIGHDASILRSVWSIQSEQIRQIS